MTRLFPEPVAAKVPEITVFFWVIKILTTAGGEAFSDYLSTGSVIVGGFIEVVILAAAIWVQFRTRRYVAGAYWFLAYAIAIFGTGVSDTMHKGFGMPYALTTSLWVVVLAGVFVVWNARERTLSIHSITTQSREIFYWLTVFATFALGTATGDLTATTMHLGYLTSGLVFTGVIAIPALLWATAGLNAVAAFWFAYVITRPLGASFADYLGKSKSASGLGVGDGPTAAAVFLATAALVIYVSVARPDVRADPTLA